MDQTAEKVQKPYYVYMMRCEDGSLYAGITTDLQRRFKEHTRQDKSGRGARYTALRRPIGYAAAWSSAGRAEASRLEYRIKKLTHGQKLTLIAGNSEPPFDMAEYTRVNINEKGEL